MSDQPDKLSADVARPLRHGWPKWWSKVEAWALPGAVLLLDLDVTIIGDLTPLLEAAAEHDLIACRNFWEGDPHHLNSSVLGWRGIAPKQLYALFKTDPERWMREYGNPRAHFKWGDQAFLHDHVSVEIQQWQTLLPVMVLSYKRELLMGAKLDDARIVVSHGQPRPWDTPNGADAWLHGRKKHP